MAKNIEIIDSVTYMEPMMPESEDKVLEDLVTKLLMKASYLAGSIHPEIARSVGKLVRSMNCYYSNLIEGHNTHPFDIERALKNDYSQDQEKRNLQLEAVAHIAVQEMIDQHNAPTNPVSIETIKWIHQEFYKKLPEELSWAENPKTGHRIKVEPGVFRSSEVKVGNHIAPSSSHLTGFIERFEKAYDLKNMSKLRQVMAVAASHHRLLWIHPFYDGNGRVARLFSHRFFSYIGIGGSLWSISRGLARQSSLYKSLLMKADLPRQGDLDGRGSLSAKGLQEFCIFFLETAIDQVEYMSSILEPRELLRRIDIYVEEEVRAKRLLKGSFALLRHALVAGSFERGAIESITGYKERQARAVLSMLIEKQLLVSDTPRGPLKLNFPVQVVERWFPKLYPL